MPDPDNPSPIQLENGYITVDHNGLITSCNEKAGLVLGVICQDILGRHCREIFSNDGRFKAICSQIEPLTKKKGGNTAQINIGSPLTGDRNDIKLMVITLPAMSGNILGAFIGFADLSRPRETRQENCAIRAEMSEKNLMQPGNRPHEVH